MSIRTNKRSSAPPTNRHPHRRASSRRDERRQSTDTGAARTNWALSSGWSGGGLRDCRSSYFPEKPYPSLIRRSELPEVRAAVDARVEELRRRNEIVEQDPEGSLFLPGERFDVHDLLRRPASQESDDGSHPRPPP